LSDFIRSWTTVERRSFYANKQLTGSCNAVNLDFRPQVQRPGLATFVALGQQNPKKKKVCQKNTKTFATIPLNAGHSARLERYFGIR